MKLKPILFLIFVILLSSLVVGINPHNAAQTSTIGIQIESPKSPFYLRNNGNESLYIHVWNSTNQIMTAPVTNCTIHIYNSTGDHIVDKLMVMDGNGIDYEYIMGYNITSFSGYYPYIIHCKNNYEAGFLSDYIVVAESFSVDNSMGGFPLAALILIPLIFAAILIGSAFLFGEDNAILKIFLFLLAYIMVFVSLWFAVLVISNFYIFPDIITNISTIIFILGVLFGFIIVYILIRTIIIMFRVAADDKKARLEY